MNGPLVQAIGWALLHLLWQGVLVAAILAAALALLHSRSANARYLASCGALLLLVALGVATAYRAYEPGVAILVSVSAGPWVGRLRAVEPAPTPITDTPPDVMSFFNAHLNQIVSIWLGV